MQVVESVSDMRLARAALSGRVGFVPTMGALHEGHAALLNRARTECDSVVASIFVNPTQFAAGEDFERYPRPVERDLDLCRRSGVDTVFRPSRRDIYPEGEMTRVNPGPIGDMLEGRSRRGHFTGVSTVVTKLFVVVRPDIAYFGEKDAQQVRVITRITRDLLFATEIVTVPTVRAESGLALSSRNAYLSGEELERAAALYRSLNAVQTAWLGGERDAGKLREAVLEVLQADGLGNGVDYVSVASHDSLLELQGKVEPPVLVSLAVRVGATRLIDNITLW